jgi:hypothetical protein
VSLLTAPRRQRTSCGAANNLADIFSTICEVVNVIFGEKTHKITNFGGSGIFYLDFSLPVLSALVKSIRDNLLDLRTVKEPEKLMSIRTGEKFS